jgi:hypothetical protein
MVNDFRILMVQNSPAEPSGTLRTRSADIRRTAEALRALAPHERLAGRVAGYLGAMPDDRQRAGWIARFRMMATRAG